MQASQENVNLSASVYWVPEQGSNSYLNYGAGISEVCQISSQMLIIYSNWVWFTAYEYSLFFLTRFVQILLKKTGWDWSYYRSDYNTKEWSCIWLWHEFEPCSGLGPGFLVFSLCFFSNMHESCRSLYYEESFFFVVPSILQKFYILFI